MILKQGNIFESNADVIIVTGNSYITKERKLVMGRGAALELKNRVPDIDKIFGSKLFDKHLGVYGLVYHQGDSIFDTVYGVFQVKYHFRDNADLDLIKHSTDMLYEHNKDTWDDDMYSIAMNFPGIGYGNLSAKNVLPIISKLQDNITIYVKDWSDLYAGW